MNTKNLCKRAGGLLLAALLLAGLTVTALAADGPTLTVASAGAAPGETVTLTAELTDNPGYVAFNVTADYDAECLELTRYTVTQGAGALAMASAATGIATYASLNAASDDGVIVTMVFRVRDDAPAGETAVGLRDVAFFDESEARIPLTVVPGTVLVTDGAAEPEETDGPAPATDTPAPTATPGVRPAQTTVPPDSLAQAGADPSHTVVYEAESGGSLIDTVTVPYPDGDADRPYRAFMVGENGSLEELEITETAEGMEVLTDPSRPIAVTWDGEDVPEAPATAVPAATQTPASAENGGANLGRVLGWIIGGLALAAAAAALLLVPKLRKKN